MNKRFEFNRNDTYRLIGVLGKEGKDKAQSRKLYQERIGCICTDIRYSQPVFEGKSILKMKFVENAEGQYCDMTLDTSIVERVEDVGDVIKVHTHNSIYVFEEAELKAYVNKDERELIELYLSSESDYMYAKGFFYDENGAVHELKGDVHIGTFQDSILLYIKANDNRHNDIMCRYFPRDDNRRADFYNNVFTDEPYSLPMLIHNVGKKELKICFEMNQYIWIIAPGESKRIIPYIPEGADEELEEE